MAATMLRKKITRTCFGKQTLSYLFLFYILIFEVSAINVVKEYYMQEGALGHCGVGVNLAQEDSIFVKTHVGAGYLDGLKSYGNNQDCTLTIHAVGDKILLKFIFFELEAAVDGVCSDYLQISTNSIVTTNATATEEVPSVTLNGTDANITLNNITLSCNETSENITCTNATFVDNSTISNNTTIHENATTIDSSTSVDNSTLFCNVTTLTNLTACGGNATSCNETSEVNVTTCYQSPPLDTPPTDQESEDTVNVMKLCGLQDSLQPLVIGGFVKLVFISGPTIETKGFSLLLMHFQDGSPCSQDQFKCDGNRCIDSSLKCDGHEHCEDGTDESKSQAGCSTLDKVLSKITGIGPYGLLGICLVSIGLVFTLFAAVIFWKFSKKPNNVSPTNDAEQPKGSVPPAFHGDVKEKSKSTKSKPDKDEDKGKDKKHQRNVAFGPNKSSKVDVEMTPVDVNPKPKSKKGKTPKTADVEW